MKKVVYSVSRTNRYGSTTMTGLGFVTESDLIIACNGKSGKYAIAYVSSTSNSPLTLSASSKVSPYLSNS